MTTILVVTQPFADYNIGDRITDADKVKATVENNPNCVVRVNLEEPEAEANLPQT